ncbi:melanoma antigen preferentially expressed in tumors-like [Rhynchocyon petersi]
MVQAWPFPRLPLGALMETLEPDQDILKAALKGIDVLLAQNFLPKTWKLKVLDLRTDIQTNFWEVWAGPGDQGSVWCPEKKEPVHSTTGRLQVEDSSTKKQQCLAPVKVVFSKLCFMEPYPDELLAFLVERVREKKHLPQLCCKKLQFFYEPLKSQIVQKILENIELHHVEELEVDCNWKLADPISLAPYVARMVNLKSYYHSRPCLSFWIPGGRPMAVPFASFIMQFLRLRELQHLHLDSIHSLAGNLDQVFRNLKSPLQTLCLTDSSLVETDLVYIALCPSTNHLSYLDLRDVILTHFSPDCLHTLLERTSTILEYLDLGGCQMTDSQITAILPALGHCSQLHYLRTSANSISMAVLESLLRHILPRSQVECLEVSLPREFYVDEEEIQDIFILEEFQMELGLIFADLGREMNVLDWHNDFRRRCYCFVPQVQM